LIGIGSLQLERERGGKAEHVNMIVPIDLSKPVLRRFKKFGRVNKPSRPWLGMYTTEIDNRVVVVGIATKGPGRTRRTQDRRRDPRGERRKRRRARPASTASSGRLGTAGVDVPLTVYHEGVTFDVTLTSTDRAGC